MSTIIRKFSVATTAAPAQTEMTTTLVKDVEFCWAKLDPKHPVNPFGQEQWEVTIHVPKARAAELESFGKVKFDETKKTAHVNLRKKATTKDGEPTKPVRVVDALKNEFDPTVIGNGSKGNVIILQKPYQIKTPQGKIQKEGVSTILSAIQVTTLVKYEKRSVVDMFDSEGATDIDANDADVSDEY